MRGARDLTVETQVQGAQRAAPASGAERWCRPHQRPRRSLHSQTLGLFNEPERKIVSDEQLKMMQRRNQDVLEVQRAVKREGGSTDTDPEHGPGPERRHQSGKRDPPRAPGSWPAACCPPRWVEVRDPAGRRQGDTCAVLPLPAALPRATQGALGARDVLLLGGGTDRGTRDRRKRKSSP